MHIPGNVSSHGARVMYIRPSLSMFPQLGMDGGMPSPRKSSAAMSSSENANVNVA